MTIRDRLAEIGFITHPGGDFDEKKHPRGKGGRFARRGSVYPKASEPMGNMLVNRDSGPAGHPQTTKDYYADKELQSYLLQRQLADQAARAAATGQPPGYDYPDSPPVPVSALPTDAEFISDSQDVSAVMDSIGLPREDREAYSSLFVQLDDSGTDYAAVWGLEGIVPGLHKTVDRLY